MTLRGKLITLIGAAVATVAGYMAFGPIIETTHFRTDIGSEADGLFLSDTTTDFSTTTINWLLAALVAGGTVTTMATALSAIRGTRQPDPNSREGSS